MYVNVKITLFFLSKLGNIYIEHVFKLWLYHLNHPLNETNKTSQMLSIILNTNSIERQM